MFEFYFQSGEFSSDGNSFFYDIFIQFFAWILAGFTAYIVIRIQQSYYISNRIEEKNNKEIDSLRYLTHLIEKSYDYSGILKTELDNFVKDLTEDPINIGSVYLSGADDLNRLTTKIDQEEYFHALRNQLKIDVLGPIFYGFDTVKNLKEQLLSYMEEFKSQYDYSRKSDYAMMVLNLANSLNDKLIILNSKSMQSSEIYKIYNTALLDYLNVANDEPTNLERFQNEFIIPFRNAVITDLYMKKLIEGDVSVLVTDAFKKYNEIISMTHDFKDNIEKDIKQLDSATDLIRKNIEVLINRYGTGAVK